MAQLRTARKARPVGSGRRVPRSKYAGTPGPGERVLQQADILLGRADDDRHLVEADTALGFSQDAARDLDALAAFAGRGKPHQFTRTRSLRRRLDGKQITRELDQIVRLGFLDYLKLDAALIETLGGVGIACRHGNHRLRRLPDERPEKLCFDFGIERDIEQ